MLGVSEDVLAIEVGSSRVKLGWFPGGGACAGKPASELAIAAPALPTPAEVVCVEHRRRREAAWLGEVQSRIFEADFPATAACVLAAVHARAAEALREQVLARRAWSRLAVLARGDVAVETALAEPNRVGIDRLLGALAVNQVRTPGRPAIVVDMGTATTVNLLSARGVFQGGAILAGPMTALAALHTATSSLPLLGPEALDAPPAAVGKATDAAMASGAYWGAVGAVRQLIERMAQECGDAPEVFITGGAAPALAAHIGWRQDGARHLPHLVLAGIRLAAQRSCKP